MSEKIIVPTLGESVTEATVAMVKNKGDKVISDEYCNWNNKVNVEVPTLKRNNYISAKEGTVMLELYGINFIKKST